MATSTRPRASPEIRDAVREVIEQIAFLQRPPASRGEAAAAKRLASELAARGARARLEPETVHGTYWVPIGLACAVAAAAAAVPADRIRRRLLQTMISAMATLSVADDLEIGRRPLRRILAQRTAHNVVAEIGPAAPGHTLVVHAHHDAARTGLVFHPAIAKLASRAIGGLIERVGGTPAPMWGAVAGPALISLAAAARMRRMRLAGLGLTAGYAAAMANIAFSRAVPGANDNLSGVAVLLALAESLAAEPPRQVRVILLSTGSEESFLEAMKRFAARHFDRLSRATTTFLCIESVGSPELVLLSGEGLLRLHRYPPDLIDVLSRLAEDEQVPLRPPFRFRLATDGQIPARAGYRTATISSMDWYMAPSNYHWPSDRPENVEFRNVARAARLASALARHLDDR